MPLSTRPANLPLAALPLAVLLGAFAIGAAPAARAADIEITIRNVRDGQGHIMVALYADEAGYDARRQSAGCMLPAAGGAGESGREVKAVFVGLPEGRYGIAVYHDLDGDGKLGTNLLGIPTEPFGFGNDAPVRLSRPGFAETAVTLSAVPASTSVTLR
ncbi:DUF2141 domain-containing protein [Skermanella mucosa]|uniref:DUF2141 domain-containing protein n=1 Tax=Skermanella mucosa TaxID=1789672 RepID=UPI00192A7D1D|nr:DUF2141 domain-containing protein [Skermanella mucosa]UEM20572.1 DUF2141 domain-containing protein [Skermanella mucosa]